MKNLKLLSILALAITFFAISCTKEGPQGPAGTANVIYSAWVKKAAFSSNYADTSLPDYAGTVKRAILSAPSISSAIIDNGIVISFVRVVVTGTNGPNMLPYIFTPNPGYLYKIGMAPAVGKIIYYTENLTANPVVGWIPSSDMEYRYVVIPGGTTVRKAENTATYRRGAEKAATINGRVYSESQLRVMPYNEICALLNIQP